MPDIILLDGSVGQQLVNRTGVKDTPLWSTKTLIDHPDYVRDVHDSYFQAGCLIATTNSYNVLPDRLSRFGLLDQRDALIRAAATIAAQARDAYRAGFVAGSIGPLGASYVPDTETPADAIAEVYAHNAKILAEAADLILIETIASIPHAVGSVMGARAAGKPVWLAVTVNDKDGTCLRSGEPLSALMEAIRQAPPDAMLINCSMPEAVDQGMPELTASLPTGAYGNGFTEIVDAFLSVNQKTEDLAARTDLDPEAYARFALRWASGGAAVLGGCCEIGPDHMAHLRARLIEEGYTLAQSI